MNGPISFQREDFHEIRKRMHALHHKILPLIMRQDIRTAVRHLNLLHKKTLVFENEREQTIFLDFLVHSHRPRGFNSAQAVSAHGGGAAG